MEYCETCFEDCQTRDHRGDGECCSGRCGECGKAGADETVGLCTPCTAEASRVLAVEEQIAPSLAALDESRLWVHDI